MKKIKEFFQMIKWTITRPEMLILPGHLAFFFFLSIVPTITLISYGASFLNLSIDFLSNFISKAFGTEVSNLIMPAITSTKFSFKFIITVLLGYFVASNGAATIIVTSNTIYGIKDKGFLKRRLKAAIMTFFIILLFLFILLVPVFGEKIIELIRYVNLNAKITKDIVLIFNILRSPISWFVIFLFIKIIYTMAPDRRMPSSDVNRGAIFTSFAWIIITRVFSYYIYNFSVYNIFYGSLANIVILMLWIFLLAYIFVIGMAMNSRVEEIKLEKTAQL